MFTVATIGCGLAVLALAWALRRQAPSGTDPGALRSYSGSAATSTHSPKTSTSARWPISVAIGR